MWHSAMHKHLKKLLQSGELAPTLEKQTPIEAIPASTEIILTFTEVGTKELPSVEPTVPYTISSYEFDQPLRSRKRFQCLRHGYDLSFTRLSLI